MRNLVVLSLICLYSCASDPHRVPRGLSLPAGYARDQCSWQQITGPDGKKGWIAGCYDPHQPHESQPVQPIPVVDPPPVDLFVPAGAALSPNYTPCFIDRLQRGSQGYPPSPECPPLPQMPPWRAPGREDIRP